MIHAQGSSKSIIAKFLADTALADQVIPVSDMVEWIGEALDQIRSLDQYSIKITGKGDEPALVASNYQARLPLDSYKVLWVAYSSTLNGVYKPIRYSAGSMNVVNPIYPTSSTNYVAAESELLSLAMTTYDMTYLQALNLLATDPVKKEHLTSLLRTQSGNSVNTTSSSRDVTYVLTSNYIKLNVSDGYLMVAYLARPVDEEGYPLVPDILGYSEALFWYLQVKSLYPRWASGLITDRVYMHAEAQYRHYVRQAYANSIPLTVDVLESIKNETLQLMPNISHHSTFFSNYGEFPEYYNV
jgi:hypothetical protein